MEINLSVHPWVNGQRNVVYTVEYYSALKMKACLLWVMTVWMTLKVMWWERWMPGHV